MSVAGPGASRRRADLSDEQIIGRVCAGDTACYELLVRRYNQRLYRIVRSILRDDSEVEDVMQEAYLSAYRRLADFSWRARFSTWLIRIAINAALDRLRKSGRFVPFDPTLEEARARLLHACGAGARDPEQQTGERELGRMLEVAIEALPAPFRTAYVLRELEGMPAVDAAECLGVEEGTVKTRVHRAKRLLREAISREVDDASDLFPFGGERCDRVVAAVLDRVASPR
ncbi:MAG TPA: RNA polymerase sigma factor [Myxococcota bacterium]|nr:RNA polymerase sigma factor [Myxococcota bacterium]